MKKISLGLLFLITYYNFTFIFNKFYQINFAIVYIIALFGILFNIKIVIRIFKQVNNKYTLGIVSCFLACLFWATIIPILMNTYDFSYTKTLNSIIRQAIKSLFILTVFIKKHKENATFNLFCKYMILSTSLYVLSSVIFLILPSFKEFWYNVIYDSELNRSLVIQKNYIMRFGLVGFSGFQQTFICSLSSMLNIYIILNKEVNKEKYNFWLLTLVILLLGNMFYGRVGLLATLIGIFILIIILSKRRVINLFKISIMALIFIGFIFFIKDNIPVLKNWFNWAFAMFIEFFETGHFETGSSNIMFETMYIDIPIKTFFLGDAMYSNPYGSGYYLGTDIGFIRPILFYGVFFTVIGYMILGNIILGIKKGLKKYEYKYSNLLIFLLIFLVVFFELKGEIFYKMAGFLVPLYFLAFYEKNQNKLKEGEN